MNNPNADPEGNPLRITVTAAAVELLAMRALAREAIPMLLRPECYSLRQRGGVAENLRLALDGEFAEGGSLADWMPQDSEENEEPDGYEPGNCLEWPEGKAETSAHREETEGRSGWK